MTNFQGIIAAALTPIKSDLSLDLQQIPEFLQFLHSRGCHGALILGTTGEGPSFSITQRKQIYKAALEYKKVNPDFIFLAGTGTPSLDDTQDLTRFAYDVGYDAVVVLPPYYFRSANVQGLYDWYSRLISKSVPTGAGLFGYHIPGMTGVPLTIELLSRLKSDFPSQFLGIKDSSGDPDFAVQLGKTFGSDLKVFTGNDKLFSHALENHAVGCITALANLASSVSREMWDTYDQGQQVGRIQKRLTDLRVIMDQFPPAPSFLKAVLPATFDLPPWTVYPPLVPSNLSIDALDELTSDLKIRLAN